ncbi:MAG: peptide synthetase [Actinobacteria bacterium]|nr:peptide synthetase [Actinomycetota bacterium]
MSTVASGTPADTPVRPIGAFERVFYRFAERNPTHFSVVAEFDETLAEPHVRTALGAVQRRHPLLRVRIADDRETGPAFHLPAPVIPVGLTTYVRAGADWRPLAAAELARPFDRSVAPLVRALLLTGVAGSAVILTFDHTVADGISAIRVLDDLVVVLNGGHLTPLPVPPSQEDMIDRLLPRPLPTSGDAPDGRMSAPTTVRPFDGTPPDVVVQELDAEATIGLARRCRAEATTVHGAMVTAVSWARSAERGDRFVRVLSPIDVRALLGADGDCAVYLTAGTTGLDPADGGGFWDQARSVTAQLTPARTPAGVASTSARARQAMPVDAGADVAQAFFTQGIPFDLLVSNLGVQEFTAARIRPRAVWGPLVQSQVADAIVVGIVTYRGCLRMVGCGYQATQGFLARVAGTLTRAGAGPLSSDPAAPLSPASSAGPRR